MNAPTKPTYWARWVSGNADRHHRTGLTREALDRLVENVGQRVEWGPDEPMLEVIE